MQLVDERAQVEQQPLADAQLLAQAAAHLGALDSRPAKRLVDDSQDPFAPPLQREGHEDTPARRANRLGPELERRAAPPSATSSGPCEPISTPASPTTSGIAVTFMTTGTQPASIASATASPKPSWREACT